MIEAKTESSQGTHSAPFPRALVEFFVKAYSDPGDLIFDPFLGSGTTMAAAACARTHRVRHRDLASLLRRDPAPDDESHRRDAAPGGATEITWADRDRSMRVRRSVSSDVAVTPTDPTARVRKGVAASDERMETTILEHAPRQLAVQIWPIERLLPYARNARTHSDGAGRADRR